MSADGKALYYTTLKAGSPRLMKVSSEGGAPEAVMDAYFQANDISTDGKRVLGVTYSDTLRRAVLAVYTLEDRKMAHLPELPTNALFMPDGALAGVQRIRGKSVIGVWPAGGGPFKPITPAHQDNIFGGAVSPDGRIAFSRGRSTNDVVLITAKQESK